MAQQLKWLLTVLRSPADYGGALYKTFLSVLVLFLDLFDYLVGDRFAVADDEDAEGREDKGYRAIVEQGHICAGKHTDDTVDYRGSYLCGEGCGVVIAGECADLVDTAYFKHERQGVDGDEHIRRAAHDKSYPDERSAECVDVKYLGQEICAERNDEYDESAEYCLFAAELLAEPACRNSGDCGSGGKCSGHDGCLSGGLMKNLIGKQREES